MYAGLGRSFNPRPTNSSGDTLVYARTRAGAQVSIRARRIRRAIPKSRRKLTPAQEVSIRARRIRRAIPHHPIPAFRLHKVSIRARRIRRAIHSCMTAVVESTEVSIRARRIRRAILHCGHCCAVHTEFQSAPDEFVGRYSMRRSVPSAHSGFNPRPTNSSGDTPHRPRPALAREMFQSAPDEFVGRYHSWP